MPSSGQQNSHIKLGLAYILTVGFLMVAATLESPSLIWGAYALVFLPYFLVLRQIWGSDSRFTVAEILVMAAVARVALLALEPMLSDDLYRYIWEGRVVAAGLNPFVHPPDAQSLAFLRDPTIWPLINHKEVATIYPPVAQYLFAFNGLLGGGAVLQRVIFLVIEAVGIYATLKLTDAGHHQTLGLAIYALNPLVVVETAWSGHLDVIAWIPAVLGVIVWSKRTSWRGVVVAGALLGLSIGAKFLGIFALFAMAIDRPYWGPKAWSLWRDRLLLVATSILLVAMSYAPFVADGGLFSGFGTYAASWRSNDGIFRAETAYGLFLADRWSPPTHRLDPEDPQSMPLFRFSRWDEAFVARGWTKEWNGQTYPDTTFGADQVVGTLAKVLGAFLVLLAVFWCLVVGGSVPARFIVLMGTLLWVAPTVHPWYVAWLIPFAAITRDKWPILFSFTCLAGYASWHSAAVGGPWAMPAWLVFLEYSVVAAVAFRSLGRGD